MTAATPTPNPLGLRGIGYIEFTSPEPEGLHALFTQLGFSRTERHRTLAIDLYRQNDVVFLLNREATGHGAVLRSEHGPTACAMGWRFDDPAAAREGAIARGAQPFEGPAPLDGIAALKGIGGSLIALLPADDAAAWQGQFEPHPEALHVPDHGYTAIDHLTNNVVKGTLMAWRSFYQDVFGFTDVRTFDIRGQKTGLFSYALRSPDGSFCIPLNEGTETASQIEEFLREHRGAGIQHVALLTGDLLASLDRMGDDVKTLDIDPDYYRTVFDRVPNVTEDRERIQAHKVLVDGDDEGYLLQIFTENVVGPAFFEMIQRKNHWSFGEGNFGALFRSIERDQERRGVLSGAS